jgi:hypothetical protein
MESEPLLLLSRLRIRLFATENMLLTRSFALLSRPRSPSSATANTRYEQSYK